LFVPVLKKVHPVGFKSRNLPVKRRGNAKTPTDQQHKLQIRAFDLKTATTIAIM